jgi:DNA excision repair protein ERCC-3
MSDPTNPLIVQGDLSVLAEVSSPRFDEARAKLARFAELEKAPEHIHTYRITPLSLWNAAVSGLSSGDVAATITGLAKYPVAPSVLAEVHDQMGRYGRLRLVRDHDTAALALTSAEPALLGGGQPGQAGGRAAGRPPGRQPLCRAQRRPGRAQAGADSPGLARRG